MIPVTFAQLAALAVPSRVRLIKALGPRKANITELAERTGMAKSTVHTHLRVLVRAELVRREPDERKWVYHSLTPLGRRVAEMEPLRFVLVSAVALALALAGVATMVWGWFHPPRQELPWAMPPIGAPPEPAPAATDLGLVGALLLLLAVLLLLTLWLWARRRLGATPPQLG